MRAKIVALLALGMVLVLTVGGVVGAPAAQDDPDGEAEALLRRAAEAMGEVESFHFELTHDRGATTLAEGIELTAAEGDVRRPDRFRADVEASLAGLPLELEIIGVGSTVWVTDPTGADGTYREIPADAAAIAAINPEALLAAVGAIREPEIAGEEEIGGEPVTRVDGIVDPRDFLGLAAERLGTPTAEGEATAAAGAGMALDPLFVEIWIDEAGRVVRLRLTGALTEAEDPDVVRRLELSAFDEEVEIEAPGG